MPRNFARERAVFVGRVAEKLLTHRELRPYMAVAYAKELYTLLVQVDQEADAVSAGVMPGPSLVVCMQCKATRDIDQDGACVKCGNRTFVSLGEYLRGEHERKATADIGSAERERTERRTGGRRVTPEAGPGVREGSARDPDPSSL